MSAVCCEMMATCGLIKRNASISSNDTTDRSSPTSMPRSWSRPISAIASGEYAQSIAVTPSANSAINASLRERNELSQSTTTAPSSPSSLPAMARNAVSRSFTLTDPSEECATNPTRRCPSWRNVSTALSMPGYGSETTDGTVSSPSTVRSTNTNGKSRSMIDLIPGESAPSGTTMAPSMRWPSSVVMNASCRCTSSADVPISVLYPFSYSCSSIEETRSAKNGLRISGTSRPTVLDSDRRMPCALESGT